MYGVDSVLVDSLSVVALVVCVGGCVLSLCIEIVVCCFSSVEEKRGECFIIIVFLFYVCALFVCVIMSFLRGNMGWLRY